MKKLRIKALLSTLLMLVVLLMAVSVVMLYFGKTGLVLGISRFILREIHFWAAVSLCVLLAAHLALNFRAYLAGFRGPRQRGGSRE